MVEHQSWKLCLENTADSIEKEIPFFLKLSSEQAYKLLGSPLYPRLVANASNSESEISAGDLPFREGK